MIIGKLPTAKIIRKNDDKFLIEAEVFGKGIVMWLLSQGDNIKVLSPKELIDEIYKKTFNMTKLYS